MVMLLAGEDTTANTLAWMIHLLWQHPDALARAREEVRRICGNTTLPALPTLEQLGQLDFVEACAHEAMRLKPVAPQNTMQALRDTTLGDVHIPAGMIVMAVMRRDAVSERHFPQAHEFQPERWLADAASGEAAGSASSAASSSAKRISMPFGAGPRICPGRYLALVEIKMAMALLLANFDLTAVDTPDGQPPREVLQLAMAPSALRMRLAAR
jgi:cytochrome P450